MRAILILVGVVIVLALIGWVTFSTSPDRATMNVETETIKQDTSEMVDAGERLVESAEDSLDDDESPATTDQDTTAPETQPATPAEEETTAPPAIAP